MIEKKLPEVKFYQPEIDGLRSIAVMAVILFHAGFSIFSGGYVGVDVFFVISGFLITRLLVNEVEKNSKVDFGRFYLRRARRLLPAMFFTLFCTTVLAAWFLSPQQLVSYGGSLLHAVLSFSNLFFYSESGYFETTSSLKPLLHTWSLGVEEQFYFIWPFLIGCFVSRKVGLPILIVVVGLLSFYFCQLLISGYADATFFLTPFRVFEFSIGAILVWLVKKQPKEGWLLELILLIGLSMVTYSIFLYDEATVFPGISALLPCIGTALCIYAGNAKYLGLTLSNRVSVSIGLISYSLYLVHWPIMVFYKSYLNSGELRSIESLLLVIVSLVAAVLMYFVIEKPFRKIQKSNVRFLLFSVIIALILSYIGASMWANSGWGWRSWATSESISIENLKKGKERRFRVRQKLCQKKGWDACDDLVDGQVNSLVIGDSHAVDGLNAFEAIYPYHNFSLSQLGGCPPYHDIESITPAKHPDRLACKALNLSRYDVEYLKQFDYIVINVMFGWYTPEYLKEYLSFLKVSDIEKVVVLGDYFVLTTEMYEVMNFYGFDSLMVMKNVINTANPLIQLKAIVEEYKYFFLSKRDAFCSDGYCEIFDENRVPFTYDRHHLSYEFAVKIAVTSKARLDNYFGEMVGSSQGRSFLKSNDLTIGNWGPQSTVLGVIPNRQPGGEMGVWVQLSGVTANENFTLLLNDEPALITLVQKDLITATISSSMLKEVGKLEVKIINLATDKVITIGYFVILENDQVEMKIINNPYLGIKELSNHKYFNMGFSNG